MNFIAFIILFALFADLVLNSVAEVLNLSRLSNDLPGPFIGVYDEDRYGKSQDYLRVNTRFGWIKSLFDIVLVLGFWFGKGFPWLDNLIGTLQLGPVFTGLIYMGVLLACRALLSLPFRIYHVFVIEERFEFNKTNFSTFAYDTIKGVVVAVLLGGSLLGAVLWFFQYSGPYAWLYCWVVTSIFILGVQFIAPVWIMPLFNKFTPLEDGELRRAIMDYAKSIDFSLNNIFTMDGSKRSTKANAFFTGFGRNKRIVLYDTLIEQQSVSELVAVLAHEMGHYKKKHIFRMMVIGIAHSGIVFYLLSFFLSYHGLFDAFYMDHRSIFAGLIFFGMLYSPIDLFLGLFLQALSRKNEYEADCFAAETTGNPSALVHALKKLSVKNLANLMPHPFYVFLNYSHPPVLDRIKALERGA